MVLVLGMQLVRRGRRVWRRHVWAPESHMSLSLIFHWLQLSHRASSECKIIENQGFWAAHAQIQFCRYRRGEWILVDNQHFATELESRKLAVPRAVCVVSCWPGPGLLTVFHLGICIMTLAKVPNPLPFRFLSRKEEPGIDELQGSFQCWEALPDLLSRGISFSFKHLFTVHLMSNNSGNFVRSFYFISWNYELCKGTSLSFCPYSTLQVSEDQNIFLGWLDWLVDNCGPWELTGRRNCRYEVPQTDFLWEGSRTERITSKLFPMLIVYDSVTQQLWSWEESHLSCLQWHSL